MTARAAAFPARRAVPVADGAAWWATFAVCAQLALAAGVLGLAGFNDHGLHIALRATARLMFLFFWLAYAGPAFEVLRRRARNFGLAFAAALAVHLGLVGALVAIGHPPDARTFVIFGSAAALIYLAALFSLPRLQAALGARGWKILRVAAMNGALAAFVLDFAHFRSGLGNAILYWPFIVLVVAAPVMRPLAWMFASRASPQR
jgi:hypothetical protein